MYKTKKYLEMYNQITTCFLTVLVICCFFSCNEQHAIPKDDFVIAKGQIPNIAEDNSGTIHLVYGKGDSIMYCFSPDKGNSFSAPALVAVLPGLFSYAMRGPQIAATSDGPVITGCTSKGNIFSYRKVNEKWQQGARINDADTVAKEGFMALAADGKNVFAVWLDLRGNKRNKIYGAASEDDGKSWSGNIMIYTSPDTSVCPCCKPSVIMKHERVYVMFRNWLHDDRDLYLVQSSDAGHSFGVAQKLGKGSWKLNACPMDGGGLTLNKNGEVQTVWNRKGKIFTAIPGVPEIEIGKGGGCTVATVGNENVFAWSDENKIICMKANGAKKTLGEGNFPVLTSLDREHFICIWQNENHIHGAVVKL